MAVIEGVSSGSFLGVGAESFVGAHMARGHMAYGSGGYYAAGATSGTMAAALGANSEIFQFRYVTAASRIALVYRVTCSASLIAAATAAGSVAFRLTVARSWTVVGSAGIRLTLTGDNVNLRTSMATSEVNDAGISTTAALTTGTKTLDATDLANISVSLGTGAITTMPTLNILNDIPLFNSNDCGGHPLVLANQEGFVIRSGANAWPATATWSFSVNVSWAEVPAY